MKDIKLSKKSAALILATVMLVGGVSGGTLAWLTANSTKVENIFTTSNIGVNLGETRRPYQMIPGWTIPKDPVASVDIGSEDCYLFVKVEESTEKIIVEKTEYVFGDFIKYEIASGWEPLSGEDGVYYRVIDSDTEKGKDFNILGAGTYSAYSWGENQVLTKPEVTKEMMDAVTADNQPKLTFTAYAVQLWKKNKPENEADYVAAQFTAAEAWNEVKPKNSSAPST